MPPEIAIMDAPPPVPANTQAAPASNPPADSASNPPPGDDADFLPMAERIRRDAERADQLIRDMAAAAKNAPAEPAPADPASAVPPQGAQPPANPGANPPDSNNGSESEAELRRQLSEAINDAKTWRGRTETERARSDATIADLQRQIAELRGTKAKQGLDDALKGSEAALTEEDREAYGDMLDVMRRAVMPDVRALVAAAVEGLRAEIAESLGPVAERVETTAASIQKTEGERFMDTLAQRVTNLAEKNNDPGFLAWLAEPDPLFGVVRKEALDNAVNSLDVDRVAVFFQAYFDQRSGSAAKDGVGGSGQPAAGASASGPPAAPAAPSGPEPPPSLADFAAPGAARGATEAPTSAAGTPKRWKGSEIRVFYNEVRRGQWATRPVEKERIEREIGEAQRSGNVDYAA